ncbi:MAG TPA: SDR family NAD(P)-dependent oxidoreductase [Steroidobacteraceae bacterium]|nr:SDR family NAD(P)-dependent oxidoreductase [Steroidobacteraceae bacterium]
MAPASSTDRVAPAIAENIIWIANLSGCDMASGAIKVIGYSASKAALNMLTVQLAYLLRDTAIKVNSADPGYTATDLNGHRGEQTTPEGAAEAIRLALLPDDGPTGTYSDRKGIVPW